MPETLHQSREPVINFDFDTLTELAEQSPFSLEEFIDITWKLYDVGALFYVTNTQQLSDITQKLKAGYQPVQNEGWVMGLFINSPDIILGKQDLCEAICAERDLSQREGYEIIDSLIAKDLLIYKDDGDISLNDVARFMIRRIALIL